VTAPRTARLPDLSPAYLERLAAPRGRGDLEPADLAGEVGSVVGGSGVRVTLRLAKDATPPRRVAAARFRAFGSAAPLGPGSVLVERVVGLDVDAAAGTTPDDLLAPLGAGLPPAVRRAAEHLAEALRRALREPDAAARAHVGAPGVLVCRCLGVGDRPVRRAIRGGARDVPAIGHVTSAGHGCHSCWPDLRALLFEEAHAGDAPPPPHEGGPMSRAVDAVVRPLLLAQGLSVGPVRIQGDGVVRLRVASGSPDALASPIGAVAMARHALRETISEDVRVEPEDAPGPDPAREGTNR
jgi:bacterioferritin-associated ferredoxin